MLYEFNFCDVWLQSRDAQTRIEEQYRNEVHAQEKLIDLYKVLSRVMHTDKVHCGRTSPEVSGRQMSFLRLGPVFDTLKVSSAILSAAEGSLCAICNVTECVLSAIHNAIEYDLCFMYVAASVLFTVHNATEDVLCAI